jgi:hypothetical protein
MASAVGSDGFCRRMPALPKKRHGENLYKVRPERLGHHHTLPYPEGLFSKYGPLESSPKRGPCSLPALSDRLRLRTWESLAGTLPELEELE